MEFKSYSTFLQRQYICTLKVPRTRSENSEQNRQSVRICITFSVPLRIAYRRNRPIASIASFLFQSVSTRARRTTTTSGTPSTTHRRRASYWTRPASRTAVRSRRCRKCRSCRTRSSACSSSSSISSSSIAKVGVRQAASSGIGASTWSDFSYRRSCSRSRCCSS